MHRQTVDILSDYRKAKKFCVMGNVAIARGAIEANVNGVFSYPGTPSTEISEVFKYIYDFQHNDKNENEYSLLLKNKIYFEYSINEKIALEKAIAFSIAHKSAMCVMKNVGMNVASDALMSITYQTLIGPLVIVICDDPGCHSSSNEQDSRYWGIMASVPVFNPATPEEAIEMTKSAFELSDKLKLPVIVRSSTRVSHSRGVIEYNKLKSVKRVANFDRIPEHINIPARTSAAHLRLINKLNDKEVVQLVNSYCKQIITSNNSSYGIICSGVALVYIQEIISKYKLKNKINVLSIGVVNPVPEKSILKFLNKKHKRILILEELDPIIENAIRIIAQKNGIRTEIIGKGFAGIISVGEFSLDLIKNCLFEFLKIKSSSLLTKQLSGYEKLLNNLPPRPPALCAGCPHRATFYLLKLAIPRGQSELILCGDIGCFGLGALPPLKMIDTINHMGMSISMAQGIFEAYKNSNYEKKIVALVGDGTFFHSGLNALVNAVYTKANILLVIFDNRTIGMTGHQSHPGASQHSSKYNEIEIAPLLKGLGIQMVENINPFSIKSSFETLNKAMNYHGVSVIIAKAPCIFLPDYKDKIDKKMRIEVVESLCNSCANHEDVDLNCSRCYSPLNNLKRAKAKLIAPISIPGTEQLCPANICNHGFFNSILEGNNKAAIEIIRDKMLFAKTCGDICHRPCEVLSEKQNVVPIRALKKYVSSDQKIFIDFETVKDRVKKAIKKHVKIAIVGAGPAGLSSAYDLIQQGYDVDIYEREAKPGGMIASVIPDFRLNKDSYLTEAMLLDQLGVNFKFNQTLGKDFAISDLVECYQGIIIAIGLMKPKTIEIIEKSIPHCKRLTALDFLRAYNLKKIDINSFKTIVIIGGGNSAFDAARAAKKLNSNCKVIVVCIESVNDMPAFDEEIQHAMQENINIVNNAFVKKVDFENEINLTIHNYNTGDFVEHIRCDFVITAIGQDVDNSIIDEIYHTKKNDNKLPLKVATIKNTIIIAAGDILSDNHNSLIGAIASGKQAANEIRKNCEHYHFDYEGKAALEKLNSNLFSKKELPNNDIDFNRLNDYNLYQSCMKCNHCIDNFGCPAMIKINGKVKIDQSRCTLCGLCIDVCPNNAIKWVVDEKIKN